MKKNRECYADVFTKELHGPLNWALQMVPRRGNVHEVKELEGKVRPLIFGSDSGYGGQGYNPDLPTEFPISITWVATILIALTHLLQEAIQAAWNHPQTFFWANTHDCLTCFRPSKPGSSRWEEATKRSGFLEGSVERRKDAAQEAGGPFLGPLVREQLAD